MEVRIKDRNYKKNIHSKLVKYNKRLLDKKNNQKVKIIGLDWLQLAFTGSVDENSHLQTLLPLTSRENFFHAPTLSVGTLAFHPNSKSGQFKYAVNVFHLNRFMGVLYFAPKNQFWKHDLMHFKFDNEALYNSRTHPKRFLKLLQKTLKIQYTHVVRMDVFVDFHRINQRTTVKSFTRNVLSGKVRKVGKRSKIKKFNSYQRAVDFAELIKKDSDTIQFYNHGEYSEGLTIGSRTSGKYMRIYNKSKEMESNPKPYIKAHWNANGINNRLDVYRAEFELKTDFFRQLEGDYTLDNLFDKDLHLSLFEYASKNYFEFVYYDEKQKRVDRMKPYELFNYDELKMTPDFVYRLKRKKTTQTLVSKKSVMQSIRMAMLHYVKSNQSVGWFKYAYNMALRHGLLSSMDKKLETWFKSFYEKLPEHFEFSIEQFTKDYHEVSKLNHYGGYKN